MTTLVNQITVQFTSAEHYGAVSNGIAVLAVGLLVLLLVERVLLEAKEGRPVGYRMSAFNMLIWPMVLVMGLTVVLRAAQILHLW